MGGWSAPFRARFVDDNIRAGRALADCVRRFISHEAIGKVLAVLYICSPLFRAGRRRGRSKPSMGSRSCVVVCHVWYPGCSIVSANESPNPHQREDEDLQLQQATFFFFVLNPEPARRPFVL